MVATSTALDRARLKAYFRLMPLLFLCYVIAYVDRQNVAIAKLTMSHDMPAFTDAVIGLGAGVFFLGYFLLEIPGTLIVERWSARKWICRIMISWGIMAALTAAVTTPWQFYAVRFLLGLAEAGFFPGIIVFLTHWFPIADRARAISIFLIATPVAQIASPKLSGWLLTIGTDQVINGTTIHHPELWGLKGWQVVYVFWGIPAVLLGLFVLYYLPDRPRDAGWLKADEREALEAQLKLEKELTRGHGHVSFLRALSDPKVMLLSLAYFCTVTSTYGIEFFMPSILKEWYQLNLSSLTWLIMLPPLLALVGQLSVGWSSDRFQERRWHAVVPLVMSSLALALLPLTRGSLPLTILCLMVAFCGFKAYMPAFWSLPNLFLVESAAAGSIGMINSLGNLGGFLGPTIMGWLQTTTGSYVGGLYCLSVGMLVTASLLFMLKLRPVPMLATEA
ncbi:MAG: MFS transporter [Planctomycetales bacterium]|nr:MFS transporter [Planctomycetales bacterium]